MRSDSMKFSLIDPSNKKTLIFPVTPNELSVNVDTKTINYDHAMLGDSEMPRGSKPLRIDFSGILPTKMVEIPKVDNRSVNSTINQIRAWQKVDRKKLKLIITSTPWNLNIFINDFTIEYKGNLINYSIKLIEYKDMVVSVTKAKKKPKPPKKRPAPKPKPKTKWYTIKRGDNLWNIAKKYTGKGIRWKEMWSINKKRSRSKNPNLIYPGERFQIPAKW